jgi:hypothetical protein
VGEERTYAQPVAKSFATW